MDKTCIINPATGRAVKIDSRLGKKLSKNSTTKVVKEYPNKDKDDAIKKLQAVIKGNVTKKKYDKDKDFKKAMGEDF